MPKRKIRISWVNLEKYLQKSSVISMDEEIREITLVKPRQMLLYLKKGG